MSRIVFLAAREQWQESAIADTRRAAVAGRVLLFAAWLGVVLWLAVRHTMWRDEGRAWSIALGGDSLPSMLFQLRGEGHPPLWYVLLRVTHDLTHNTLALPAVAIAVSAVAALMLLFRSPFPLWFCALIIAGYAFVFEYTVMARNYGVAVPLLLLLATLYRRNRDRGLWLGFVCALLANTNLHAALIVCVFMLFWLIDLAFDRSLGWNRITLNWAVNGCVAAAGLALCALSVLPTYNDAAVGYQSSTGVGALATALLLPASKFSEMALFRPALALGLGPLPDYPSGWPIRVIAMSAVMFGAVLGLIRWPAAAIAGAVSLVAMSLLFTLIYKGGYRHDAIWLFFLIALYWMLWDRPRGRVGPVLALLSRLGFACLLLLLALQVPVTVEAIAQHASGMPESQVRRLARVIAARPDLRDAIYMPDPDYLLEAMPFYAANPIYLPREGRFARFSHFTNHAQVDQSLTELLQTAHRLCQEQDRPVILVFQKDLEVASLPARMFYGYNTTLRVDETAFASLKASTQFLGRFEPASTDETFGAYVLKPPCTLRD